MSDLTIYHLRLTFIADERVELGLQAGSQIRGALYDSLRRQSCPALSGHHDSVQAELCPVCWLMAREDTSALRGKDVPRAFTVQPPLDETKTYVPGQSFSIGLTLFGQALSLYPYIILALPSMGQQGIGYGRGRFHLHSVQAIHPFNGTGEMLMPPGTKIVRRPTIAITGDYVREQSFNLPSNHLTLRFLTPTRLTEARQLVKKPIFRVIVARLLERLDTLVHEYGTGEPSPWQELTAQTSHVTLTHDMTRWVEVHSGSRRMSTMTPISGFVGEAVYEGNLAPFREWLLWGQSIQIGKDTVKGNGLFEIVT